VRLDAVRREVEDYQRLKPLLERRKAVIDELDRNRTGGQELLDAIANTVVKTDQLWLTSLTRKGNSLSIEGTGATMNAVANFITQLKRSGYFDNVEIREAHQDERKPTAPTFLFSLTADFSLPQAKKAAPAAGGNS
jgi:Tfp pilus assembly protein PilN